MKPIRLLLSRAPLLALLVACGAGPSEPVVQLAPGAAPTVIAALPAPSVAPTSAAAAPPPPINPNGLTLPAKISGEAPRLPGASSDPASAKTARARCTITRAGAVEGCKIVEAPSGADALVLTALATWRYRPAHLKGEPVASQNVIELTFSPPEITPAVPVNTSPLAPIPTPTVLPFAEGMNRPTLLRGKNPDYTPEARAAGIEGVVIARCIITTAGMVRDCKLVKSIPLLDRAVLDALDAQVYTPVLLNGNPVDVLYTLTFKFRLN